MWALWTIVASLCLKTLTGAEEVNHQACFVYPLCSCSQAWRELGEVTCNDVPFSTLPVSLSRSIMHSLSLKRNELRDLSEYNLTATRLWRLEVNENILTHLKANSLSGLEQRLRQLDLASNRLTDVPTEAIRNLEKLETMNLSDNFISDVQDADLTGKYAKTLKRLNLARNSINRLRGGCFKELVGLEDLDLSSNLIHDLMADPGPVSLRRIFLGDNQLGKIPFEILVNKKQLELVDLKENRIFSSYDSNFSGKLSLKELHLERNYLSILSANSFKNFREIEKVYLNGNLIGEIKNNAFKDVSVLELYLTDCLIYAIHPRAFKGQEESIELIDLGRNNLTRFPQTAVANLTDLKTLILEGNRNLVIENDSFKDARFILQDMNVERIGDSVFPIDGITKLQELKNFQMTGTDRRSWVENVSDDFGPQLESLSLVNAYISEIPETFFDDKPRLKFLDLAMNRIEIFHANAFKPVSQSLQTLNLHRSLGTFAVPYEALCKLEELTDLDLSENYLSQIHPDSFSCLEKLEFLNLNFNALGNVDGAIFRNGNLPNLERLSLSFNKIATIKADTFEGLKKLSVLKLNDNNILTLEREAFSNLESLTELDLEGNYLEEMENETFHNLPRLQLLNMAYNSLRSFPFHALEHVGTLNTLTVDLKHNRITRLDSNTTNSHSYLSVEEMDMSYNSINFVNATYFVAFKTSLLTLNLDENNVSSLNYSVFYHLEYLQSLSLSRNGMQYLSESAFGGLTKLRVLNISYNEITDLAPRTLSENENLNVLDVTGNLLEVLPEDCFRNTKLERLEASDNEILRFPDMALLSVRKTLKVLNLSNNKIRSLSPQDVEKLDQLLHFDISYNNIKMLQSQTLSQLQNLVLLDLSNNPFQNLDSSPFEDLGNCLEELSLAATNLSSFPSLTLPRLQKLNLSGNSIAFITPQSLINVTQIRVLDLSDNNLVSAPNSAWHSLPKLRWLRLSSNPISGFSNDSFIGLSHLESLEMTDIPLQFLQKGVFRPLSSLRYIRVDASSKLSNFALPRMLVDNYALRHVHIIMVESQLGIMLQGTMNKNVEEITLEGPGLTYLDPDAFKCFQGSALTLNTRETNVTEIPRELFGRLGIVRNFTIDVRNNMIRAFPIHRGVIMNDIRPLEHLKRVLISENQLRCDCHLAWLDRWYKNLYNKDFDSADIRKRSNLKDITEDFRSATCVNKGDRPLLEVFKHDFKCQFSQPYGNGSPTSSAIWLLFYLIIAIYHVGNSSRLDQIINYI